jgi:hypothetical protein
MNVFKVFLVMIIIGILYFTLVEDVEKVTDGLSQGSDQVYDNMDVTPQVDKIKLPDYDPRKRPKKLIPKETNVVNNDDNFNADEVIEKANVELVEIQEKYTQVLDDPIARKKLEAEAKQVGIDYKKAILEKMSKGEL